MRNFNRRYSARRQQAFKKPAHTADKSSQVRGLQNQWQGGDNGKETSEVLRLTDKQGGKLQHERRESNDGTALLGHPAEPEGVRTPHEAKNARAGRQGQQRPDSA